MGGHRDPPLRYGITQKLWATARVAPTMSYLMFVLELLFDKAYEKQNDEAYMLYVESFVTEVQHRQMQLSRELF